MSCNVIKGNRGVVLKNPTAWKTAHNTMAEGGNFTLANKIIDLRTGKINELEQVYHAGAISTDVTSEQDLITLFTKSVAALVGKSGFVLHSTGI